MNWADFGPQDRTLIQGTDEWRQARRYRIGGSDIPVILRLSPYKTRRELWEERVGNKPIVDISKMFHVKRGIDAEPIARAILEEEQGVKYTTPVLKHKKYPFLVCSLDGECDAHILEIKTMGFKKHMEVSEGIIPDYYEAQCDWNMMIAGKPMLFASFRPEDQTMYKINMPMPSLERQRHMTACALQFHRWVVKNIPPPPDFVLDL